MTTTTHSVAPEDIMAFLDGELSGPEARSVSAHLKDCTQCALVAEQFRATSEMLSRWDVDAAPAALEDSIEDFAAETAAHRAAVKAGRTGFGRRRLLAIGSGAVAVMALLVVAVFFQPSGQSHSSGELVLADKPVARYTQPQLSEKMRQPERRHALTSLTDAGVAGMGAPGSGGIAGTGFRVRVGALVSSKPRQRLHR